MANEIAAIYEAAAAEARAVDSSLKVKLDEVINRIDVNEKRLTEQIDQITAHQRKLQERMYAAYEDFLDSTNEVRAELQMLRGGSKPQAVLKLEGGKT